MILESYNHSSNRCNYVNHKCRLNENLKILINEYFLEIILKIRKKILFSISAYHKWKSLDRLKDLIYG